MRRVFSALLLGLMVFASGCGGGGSSYRDRDIDASDPANVESTPIPPPES